jgi:hypothetical protein
VGNIPIMMLLDPVKTAAGRIKEGERMTIVEKNGRAMPRELY